MTGPHFGRLVHLCVAVHTQTVVDFGALDVVLDAHLRRDGPAILVQQRLHNKWSSCLPARDHANLTTARDKRLQHAVKILRVNRPLLAGNKFAQLAVGIVQADELRRWCLKRCTLRTEPSVRTLSCKCQGAASDSELKNLEPTAVWAVTARKRPNENLLRSSADRRFHSSIKMRRAPATSGCLWWTSFIWAFAYLMCHL